MAATIALFTWASLAISVGMGLSGGTATSTWQAVATVCWDRAQYFTILTNTLMAVSMTLVAVQWRQWFPGLVAGTALYATLLGLLYHFLLGGAHWHPGMGFIVDLAHHYALPAAVLLFWLVHGPHQQLGLGQPLVWLAYPLLYVTYMLIRGDCTGRYPYGILDPTKQGTPRMVVTCGLIAAAFLAGGYVVVAMSRLRKAGGR